MLHRHKQFYIDNLFEYEVMSVFNVKFKLRFWNCLLYLISSLPYYSLAPSGSSTQENSNQ